MSTKIFIHPLLLFVENFVSPLFQQPRVCLCDKCNRQREIISPAIFPPPSRDCFVTRAALAELGLSATRLRTVVMTETNVCFGVKVAFYVAGGTANTRTCAYRNRGGRPRNYISPCGVRRIDDRVWNRYHRELLKIFYFFVTFFFLFISLTLSIGP